MIRCAPPPLLASLYTRLFKGHLVKRARHPTANFVVQALMAAASSADQVGCMGHVAMCMGHLAEWVGQC